MASLFRNQGDTVVASPSVEWGRDFYKEPKEEEWQPLLDRKTLSVQIVTLDHCNELLKDNAGLSCQFECFL